MENLKIGNTRYQYDKQRTTFQNHGYSTIADYYSAAPLCWHTDSAVAHANILSEVQKKIVHVLY